MRILFIALCILWGGFTGTAAAQLDVSNLTGPQTQIELLPAYPQPGESVTATINDYQSGSFGSSIAWFLDGKEVPNSRNQRQITFTVGEGAQNLQAQLGNRTVTRAIYPHYLDIILEPQTRVPDFYLGRSLPSIGSIVNATALVDSYPTNNPGLIYTWRVNQQVVEGGALRNRNRVSFTTPIGQHFTLSVEVATLDGTTIAKRSLFVPSVSPTIKFYEASPLFGVRDIALSSDLPLIGNSVAVRAEPFHLDSRVYNDPDVHEWTINNTQTSGGGNPYEVTLQRYGTGGASALNFHVRDLTQVLQGARGSVTINF